MKFLSRRFYFLLKRSFNSQEFIRFWITACPGMGLRLLCLAAVLTGGQLNTIAAAETDVEGDSLLEGEIVVTATRSPYSLDRVSTTVRVIDQQVIQASGIDSVADLLRNHSSVQVRDNSGVDRSSQLSLRGFSSAQNLLVLVDGRKLNNTDLGGPDLSSIALKDVERIEILEGGAGALFGDQAVGGVVNIITKRRESEGGGLQLARGSYDSESYRANYHNQLSSGFYYRLNTELERADAYRDHTSLNYEHYSALLGYRYQGGEFYVEGRQSDSEYLLSGALLAGQVAVDRRQAGSSFNDYASDSRVARIGFQQHLGEHVQLLTSYSDRNEEAVIYSASGFGSAVSWQDRRVKLFDPRLILNLDRLRITLGYDKERVDYGFALDFGFGVTGLEQHHDKNSEYLHLLFSPAPGLDIQAGVRHARVDVEVQPFDVSYGQSATVHNVGVSWRPATAANRWRLYLNRDETFRFALADENVDFFGTFNLLEVQTGVAWELGAQWRGGQGQLSVAVFQHDNENEIAFDPMLGFFGANTNLDDTRRRGATVEFSWQANDSIALNSIYTYTDANFSQGVYAGNRLPDVARHLAKFNASYQINPKLHVFAEMLYVGSRQLDFAGTLDQLNGYTVFNLAAGWREEHWDMKVRVNNLTQKEYSEFATFFGVKALYPSPERNVTVSTTYRFQ